MKIGPGSNWMIAVLASACLVLLLSTALADVDVIAGPFTYPPNGHQYYLLDVAPWTESEHQAQVLGGHLVGIGSSAENAWVWNTFQSIGHGNEDQGNLWLGFNDAAVEGHWVWSDGEGVVYTNWAPFEPNNQNNEDYAQMVGAGFPGHAPMTWNDILESGLGGGGQVTPPRGVVEVDPTLTGVPDTETQPTARPTTWSDIKGLFTRHMVR
jgi:hypothetical protein